MTYFALSIDATSARGQIRRWAEIGLWDGLIYPWAYFALPMGQFSAHCPQVILAAPTSVAHDRKFFSIISTFSNSGHGSCSCRTRTRLS